MENIDIKNQAKETAEHLSAYAHNQLEISKLLFIKKTADASSFLMFVFIASLSLLVCRYL